MLRKNLIFASKAKRKVKSAVQLMCFRKPTSVSCSEWTLSPLECMSLCYVFPQWREGSVTARDGPTLRGLQTFVLIGIELAGEQREERRHRAWVWVRNGNERRQSPRTSGRPMALRRNATGVDRQTPTRAAATQKAVGGPRGGSEQRVLPGEPP